MEQKEERTLLEIKKEICKSYTRLRKKNKKIMFFLSAYFYFTDSISSLILRYLQSNKECILVFPCLETIVSVGIKNTECIIELIRKLKMMGALCYTVDEQSIYEEKYEICFLCSEYSNNLPVALRENARYVVALQVTAIYTHMYQIEGRFEEVFSGNVWQQIDYLVVSDFIADWICKRDQRWRKKILSFGYPKLDTLFWELKNKIKIPENWKKRELLGKKIYLFTTNQMEQKWLDFFADKENDRIAIWRPHPHGLNNVDRYNEVVKVSEKYNIIIDDMDSYYLSFQISDALIAQVHSSVMVNYLYTDKPICLYGREELYQSAVIDYEEEPWYRCTYNTTNAEDVLNFIREIEYNKDVVTDEQIRWRDYVKSNFDGKVCERIYNYFERKVLID